ncbi:adenylate/guanylate cyclase domain-containing protein [Kamptonema sp. UHCC 0994]|uniref:adenylate/guanylate cyclase domain-containing protein n=1 Tax=Kamptonema sp. UHCC 0994 TaxID=3031329 RepID=UPI0023B8AC6E|nr:adenylate/guanylate cyclase domain-containing protein [Kamptonema sp. UHCC 0994]MDF0551890.1 adenylate/guanylate cyclase domain-containing protein [Kamptonema sp. UHCC 0994]
MKSIFTKLLAPHHLEYLAVDREFTIVETSFNAQRFADSGNIAAGNDVRTGFPELIGTEEILADILAGILPSFELKAITRVLDNNYTLYFDLYVVQYEEEKNFDILIIFFEDVTDRMTLEQTLVQATNEMNLLLSALAGAKDYIDKIITSMVEALLVTTPSGRIKKVNQAAQNLFGYSEIELVGKSIDIVVSDKESFQRINHYSTLSQANAEIVCTTKKGLKLTVAFSCSAIQADIESVYQGNTLTQDLVYIGRDITENKRNQQRQLVQYVTTLVLSESPTLQQAVEEILAVICETLGWDAGELWMSEEGERLISKGNRSFPISDHNLLRCVESWVEESIEIPEFRAISEQITFAPGVGLPGRVWANGSSHWISDVVEDNDFLRREIAAKEGLHGAFGFPILGDYEEMISAKAVLGVMTFFSRFPQQLDEDLLQTMAAIGSQVGQFIKRKQAEEALRESEEKMRDLFENATDLIQSVAAEGHFLYVNRAWLETLGYKEGDITQMTVYDIIHPDCKEHCMGMFERVMSGEKIEQVQAEFVTKDGKKISVEGSANCKFVDGKPIATRAIFRDITERLKTEEALRLQQAQTERLLLNILPEPIANRLKQHEGIIADDFAEVTVLFADIVGFTPLSASMSPIALVDLLNQVFSAFDHLCERHGLEKIKTIGDAYMVVGGLPTPRSDHAEAIAQMAIDMQVEIALFNAKNNKDFSIRIGIHSGPVVAGVIGIKKFIYDLWGDTVNLASRMESHGLAGQIQVSDVTYELLKDKFLLQKRSPIQVKGKGEMTTYFLLGKNVGNW